MVDVYSFISIVTNALTRIFQTYIFRRQQGLKWLTQVNNSWELAVSYIYYIVYLFLFVRSSPLPSLYKFILCSPVIRSDTSLVYRGGRWPQPK